MRSSIRYGDARIDFSIRFIPKPHRRVAIHVLPDATVMVDAPEDASQDQVIAAVYRRARWIWQQQQAHHERLEHILPREYVSGESHFYLGRRYMLKVIRSADAKPGVKLMRGRFEVLAEKTDGETVKGLLEEWYRERARDVFSRRIAELSSRLRWLKTLPTFRLREMRTQWGSCSPKGTLILNPQLVKAPIVCVDYVILHELCHTKEHNHSVKYYRLLTALMPDWKQRKSELDGMAELLLNR